MARLLVERGADPNRAQTRDDQTPLCQAASKGNAATVVVLIHTGADPRLPNAQTGETPLTQALDADHQETVAALRLAVDEQRLAGPQASGLRTADGTQPVLQGM